MAWTFDELANLNDLVSAKLGTGTVAAGGNLTDADIGKPVKLAAANTYALCADGDGIDGFLVSVDAFTQDGYAFGTVQIGGRKWVRCDGAITFGYMVEAAAPAAAKTAETLGYGKVSVSGEYAAGVDTVAELLPYMQRKRWKVISGTGADTTLVLVEKQ